VVKESLIAIPIFLTVLSAILVVIADRTWKLSTDQVLLWILEILGLLALSELVQRYTTFRAMQHRISVIASTSEKFVTGQIADLFLKERSQFPSLSERVRSARQIWLLGTSLDAIVTYHYGLFVEKAAEGVHLRFLLMDPESTSVAARAHGLYDSSPASLKGDIQRTIEKVQRISAEPNASVELRITDFIPSQGLVLIDPRSHGGTIVVELYPYNVTADHRAHFELAQNDAKWYGFFLQQYDELWEASREYGLESRA